MADNVTAKSEQSPTYIVSWNKHKRSINICKTIASGQSYKHFTIVNYERRGFIRLATGYYLPSSPLTMLHKICMASLKSRSSYDLQDWEDELVMFA